MKSEAINQYIRDNWAKVSDDEMAVRCGVSLNAICKRRDRMGLKRERHYFKTVDDEIQRTAEVREKKSKDRLYNRLLTAHETLQRSFEASLNLSSSPIETHVLRANKALGGEATMVALLSDVHLEETIRPETTNGLGRYSLAIAEKRMDQYFRTLLRLIEMEQQHTKVPTLVLALLGDFISGDIHEELLETCSLPPTDAILRAQDCIASGIDFLLKNSKLNIVIVCHSGNHARTTKKVRAATEAGHSLEYLMYHNLRWHYRSQKRLTWMVPEGYLSYVDVYGRTIAFHHGHAVRYAGGVGGITISMNKAVAQWNRSRRADIYACGHFHTLFDGGNFIVNGSMIGYSPFAVQIKAAYEPPAQVMFGVHSKLGKYFTRYLLFPD